eukprot:TRINITY_DN4763_c0_g1_i7.p1 TRINITY_DN4763_c0_g1~~TRINITY_DN4763_c0_g1_i7.p1  ORF type:complete len:105 (-),score=1.20 TRINITY_DN4763_c0_g1_i7:403-717(-)
MSTRLILLGEPDWLLPLAAWSLQYRDGQISLSIFFNFDSSPSHMIIPRMQTMISESQKFTFLKLHRLYMPINCGTQIFSFRIFPPFLGINHSSVSQRRQVRSPM